MIYFPHGNYFPLVWITDFGGFVCVISHQLTLLKETESVPRWQKLKNWKAWKQLKKDLRDNDVVVVRLPVTGTWPISEWVNRVCPEATNSEEPCDTRARGSPGKGWTYNPGSSLKEEQQSKTTSSLSSYCAGPGMHVNLAECIISGQIKKWFLTQADGLTTKSN